MLKIDAEGSKPDHDTRMTLTTHDNTIKELGPSRISCLIFPKQWSCTATEAFIKFKLVTYKFSEQERTNNTCVPE